MAHTPPPSMPLDGVTHTLHVLSMNSAAASRDSSLGGGGYAGGSPGGANELGASPSAGSFTKGRAASNLPTSPTFRQNRHPFIIGVAGGTASGKTTVSMITRAAAEEAEVEAAARGKGSCCGLCECGWAGADTWEGAGCTSGLLCSNMLAS